MVYASALNLTKIVFLLPRIHLIQCMTRPKRVSSARSPFLRHILRKKCCKALSLPCRSTFTFHLITGSASDCLSFYVYVSLGRSRLIVIYEYYLLYLFLVSLQVLISRIALPRLRSKSSHQCGYFRHV